MTELNHVLGFADLRVREMREPFEMLNREGTLVTVDPTDGVRGYLSAISTGARCLERQKSDAILIYNGSGLIGVVGTILSRYYGVPLLIRQNGDILRQHREKATDLFQESKWLTLAVHLPFMLLTRAIFDLADGFIPVTATLTENIHRQTDCPTERIVAVPNSIRGEEYAPPDAASHEQSAEERRQLLTVTNLNFRGKYEGVTELVDGIVPVLREHPEVEYSIAGDGRYYDDLKRYLDDDIEGDIRDRIHVLGFVDDVATLYWNADIFVYASDIDGYPNVILEAQAAKLPIVTNPAYGIEEQIKDGASGLFVDTSDSKSVSETVSSLLADRKECDRLGQNGHDRVASENTPETVAQQLHNAVAQVLSARDERRRATSEKRASEQRLNAGTSDLGGENRRRERKTRQRGREVDER